jgi:mono/diheme cytochrome c family protein
MNLRSAINLCYRILAFGLFLGLVLVLVTFPHSMGLGQTNGTIEPDQNTENTLAIERLKRGKGRELVAVHCIPCHSTAIITANHLTREQWDVTITTMQQRHGMWMLPPALRNQILDYLESTQRPADPGLDQGKESPWASPLYRPNPLWGE